MKPILFNTEMVRAILDGRKTQTRRLVKACHVDKFVVDIDGKLLCSFGGQNDYPTIDDSPIQANDVLYVRETWVKGGYRSDGKDWRYWYKADNDAPDGIEWRPSIHMPKEAARIFLRVTDVCIERLQNISGRDVLSEGVDNGASNPSMRVRWENMQRMAFSELWDSTIKPMDKHRYGWAANPWVWVYTFERISKEEAYESAG